MFNKKLNKKLLSALVDYGYESENEFQSKCLPKINGGHDLIGVGPTLSGKTTLISIATIQKLEKAFEDAPRALILVANKEKAIALKDQFDLLAKNTDLRSVCVFEEGKINEQSGEIYFGTDLVIGTAQRILEIYFERNLNLNKIKLFVIDDAQMMIKNSWQGQVDRLALSLPKCQHLVFSNELNSKIEKLISKFILNPVIFNDIL
jgi:ATP-dependent RNA helicase RhlE